MKMVDEFKEFINRGNVMDLAVGVIIGGAFTAIVTALTSDVINPLITLISGGNGTEVGALNIKVTDSVSFLFGDFIGAIINFFIVALVVFFLVKTVNKVQSIGKKEEEAEPEKKTPTCPFCLEEVKEGATRCPHCSGAFDSPAKAE